MSTNTVGTNTSNGQCFNTSSTIIPLGTATSVAKIVALRG